MPTLKNGKHERFAQGLAKGIGQAEAYEEAGYSPSEPHASRLASNGKIQVRVAELQERAAIKVEVTVADIVRQLDEDRSLARKLKQPSAAVSATLGKAKVLGLIIDRQAHGGDPNAPPIRTEAHVTVDIAAATSEQLRVLASLPVHRG